MSNVPDDVWTDRINAFWNGAKSVLDVVLKIVTLLTPILIGYVGYMSATTHTKLDETKAELKQAAVAAADNAATAATNAKEAADESQTVKTQLAASVQERRDEFKSISDKQDETHKVLAKVVEPMNHAKEASLPALPKSVVP